MGDEESGLKIYSFGYAAENLAAKSHMLEVFPVEQLGFVDGELTADREVTEDSGIDADGNPYTVKVESSNSLKARWLQWGTNRLTPPNIRRGEPIIIYKFGDNDEYYWVSPGMGDFLRRYETAIFAFSNTSDESTEELTIDNTYSVEFNTHNKTITLRTSIDKTGKIKEPFAYTFQFNCADGVVELTDDQGNMFQLDSAERRIWMQNSDGSKLGIDKKDGFFSVPNTWTGTCRDLKIKASNSYTVNSKTISFNGSKMDVNANTSFKGSLDSNGKDISDKHKHNSSGGSGVGGTPV